MKATRTPSSVRRPGRKGRNEMNMTRCSEHGRGRKDERKAFVALRELDAKGSRDRSMEADAEAVVLLHPVEIKVRRTWSDLAGVVEERRIEEAIDDDPPLGLKEQAVLVAEAP